uniref:Periviscerokinin-3 n=1 Tax=Polyphaga aegyptiaca TaxID=7085 RepID=PVK3_POLAY|nr:RecName: Full=Periviscerokinin-3; Short=PolAe-PVK-3 [Polyphaga aegyptiaca]
PQVGLIPFPRV